MVARSVIIFDRAGLVPARLLRRPCHVRTSRRPKTCAQSPCATKSAFGGEVPQCAYDINLRTVTQASSLRSLQVSGRYSSSRSGSGTSVQPRARAALQASCSVANVSGTGRSRWNIATFTRVKRPARGSWPISQRTAASSDLMVLTVATVSATIATRSEEQWQQHHPALSTGPSSPTLPGPSSASSSAPG